HIHFGASGFAPLRENAIVRPASSLSHHPPTLWPPLPRRAGCLQCDDKWFQLRLQGCRGPTDEPTSEPHRSGSAGPTVVGGRRGSGPGRAWPFGGDGHFLLLYRGRCLQSSGPFLADGGLDNAAFQCCSHQPTANHPESATRAAPASPV